MDQQANKTITHCHDAIISILSVVEKTMGRAAATELLSRVQRTYDIPTTEPKAATKTEVKDTLHNFLAAGGYDISNKLLMFALEGTGKLYRVLAFGVPPDSKHIHYLLVDGKEVRYEPRELAKYSFNPNPSYGPTDDTFIMFPNHEARWDVMHAEQLHKDLIRAGLTSLAKAFDALNPFKLTGVIDDVPKAELVPLTNEERMTLPPVPDVVFSYAGVDAPVLKIDVTDDGYVFHTAQQSVALSAKNIDVAKISSQYTANPYWLLTATPDASPMGVPLRDVLTLKSNDERWQYYQSLIEVFLKSALREQ